MRNPAAAGENKGISFTHVKIITGASTITLVILGIGCIVSAALFQPNTCRTSLQAPALLLQLAIAAVAPLAFLLAMMVFCIFSQENTQHPGYLKPCLPSWAAALLCILFVLLSAPPIITAIFVAMNLIPTCKPSIAEIVLTALTCPVSLGWLLWMQSFVVLISKPKVNEWPSAASGAQV
jgi:hypothetical protein